MPAWPPRARRHQPQLRAIIDDCRLEAITRYRGTISGGPDFAYDFCARRILNRPRETATDFAVIAPRR